MTGRAVTEWIGKTPDSKVPPHVRLRIFRTHDGICHISKVRIKVGDLWELEHIKPLHLGGENRENNLAPALVYPHKIKSAKELKEKARADKAAKRHLGIRPAVQRPIQSAGFVPVDKEPKRLIKQLPPRRSLYKDI